MQAYAETYLAKAFSLYAYGFGSASPDDALRIASDHIDLEHKGGIYRLERASTVPGTGLVEYSDASRTCRKWVREHAPGKVLETQGRWACGKGASRPVARILSDITPEGYVRALEAAAPGTLSFGVSLDGAVMAAADVSLVVTSAGTGRLLHEVHFFRAGSTPGNAYNVIVSVPPEASDTGNWQTVGFANARHQAPSGMRPVRMLPSGGSLIAIPGGAIPRVAAGTPYVNVAGGGPAVQPITVRLDGKWGPGPVSVVVEFSSGSGLPRQDLGTITAGATTVVPVNVATPGRPYGCGSFTVIATGNGLTARSSVFYRYHS